MTAEEPIEISSDLPGYARVPRWLVENPDVSDKAVRLFAILTRWEGLERGIIPTIATIGARAGWSRSATKRAVEELRTVGAVEVGARRDDRGQTSNRYVLRYADPAERRRSTDDPRSTSGPPPRSTDGPPPGPSADRELIPTGDRPTEEQPSTSDADAPDPSEVEELPRHQRNPEEVWPAEVVVLTRELASYVHGNGHPLPGPLSVAADRWYDAVDKLLRIGPPGAGGDESLVPDADEVRAVMRWALAVDDFWPANIRSGETFRKQFSRLRVASRRQRSNGQRGVELAGAYAQAAAEARRRGE